MQHSHVSPLPAWLSSRIAGACIRVQASEERGLSPGTVSASQQLNVTCWKGKEGTLRGLPVGEASLSPPWWGQTPKSKPTQGGGAQLLRGSHVTVPPPLPLCPPVWSQPVDSSGRKNAPHPHPKLPHICAQTKPAINPSFCVSVWVLNSTWICRLLEGEIGGDLVTTKGTH